MALHMGKGFLTSQSGSTSSRYSECQIHFPETPSRIPDHNDCERRKSTPKTAGVKKYKAAIGRPVYPSMLEISCLLAQGEFLDLSS